MTRSAFKMYLKPGCVEEYKKRHNAIWPELKELLRKEGISDYSIFWDRQTNVLYAVQKSGDEKGSQDLGKDPLVKKWWDYMSDIMEVNEDNSPVSIPMPELFYLE